MKVDTTYTFMNKNLGDALSQSWEFESALKKMDVDFEMSEKDIPMISTTDENNNVQFRTFWICTIRGNSNAVGWTANKLNLMDYEAGDIKKRYTQEASEINDKMKEKLNRVEQESVDRADKMQRKANTQAEKIKGKADEKADKIRVKAHDEAVRITTKAKDKAERIREKIDNVDKAGIQEIAADSIEEEATRKSDWVKEKSEIKADKILDEAHERVSRIRERTDDEYYRICDKADDDGGVIMGKYDVKIFKLEEKSEKELKDIIKAACQDISKKTKKQAFKKN